MILVMLLGLVITALSWVDTSAQIINRPSDIRKAFLSGESKIICGFDSRRSFVSNRDVKILGARAGVEMDGKIRTGFGIYFLRSPFYRTFFFNDPQTQEPDTVLARLRFNYMTFFVEPVLLSTRRWEVSFPLHLGVGDSQYEAIGPIDAFTLRTVVLTELGVQGHYKIFPWIGLGAGVGFRQMIRGNQYVREDFNAPTYSFAIKIFTGYIINKLFGKEE